jgi:hypothetical protein
MKTLTQEEFEKLYGRDTLNTFDTIKQSRGFLSRVGSSLKDSFIKGKAQVQGTGEYADSIAPVRGVQLAGTGAMAIPKAVMAGLLPDPAQEFISENIGKPVASGFNKVTDVISDSPTLQRFVMENPNATKIIEETMKVTGGLAETASGLLATQGMAKTAMSGVNLAKTGATKATELASQGVNLAKTGATKVADVTRQGVDLAKTGATKTSNFIQGAKDVVKPLLAEAKTLPAKARTNIAHIKATEATIKGIPNAGQNAVRSGVQLKDVKDLYKIGQTASPQLKKLVKVTQDFASGKSKTNPFEVVGKPITQGLKVAQGKATTIGSKIAKVADTLPKVTTAQVAPKVIANLKSVRGLEGLKVNSKGILDFKNTTLATAGTKADRLAIQKIFTDAIKAGSGKSKHLLRQELFEILGGKKKSGLALTGTQEKAFEAVRKGLADTLDDLNPTYKALNMDYAKTISPIQKIQKLLNSTGVDEDLLDMKAGLLARRLTSFSKSNPEIRQILRDLDNVIATKGKTLLKTEQLQDFYNILDKYYDIAGQTGFQGQVTAGVSKALESGGLSRAISMVEGQFSRVFGETDIVKQKALEEVLKQILKI